MGSDVNRTAGRLGSNGRRSARTLADLDEHPLPIYSRAEVLRRLGATLQARSPIVAAGSSCGLVAKSAEAGGADLIVVYSTGISRLRGLPTTIFGEPNDMSLAMAGEILNVVESIPVICGVEAADPQHTRLSGLLEKVVAAGYSGIINFPTVTLLEPGTRQREAREGLGFGFARELELVRKARAHEVFTMSYVFLPEEAAAMTAAGVDCIVAHVGGTTGGMDGFRASSIDDAIEGVNGMLAAARDEREDVLVLAHGGALDSPAAVEQLYRLTDAQGFVGASSVERIPIEVAVSTAVRNFKQCTPRVVAEASSSPQHPTWEPEEHDE
jgi:predicted TIM-barrel enzyme